MRLWTWTFLSLALPSAMWAETEILALQLECEDVPRCARFYRDAFDFEPEPGASHIVRSGDVRIVLRRGEPLLPAGDAAHINLNLSVGDLAVARQRTIEAGGRVSSERLTSAVGPYLAVEDPAGNSIHLIDHPWDELPSGAPPVVFNLGLSVPDLPASEAFFTGLGFRVATRDYLPQTLVFERTGMTQLVLHRTAKRAAAPREATGTLVVRGTSSSEVHGPSGIVVRRSSGHDFR